MAQGIIQLVSLLNRHGHLFVFDRLLGVKIKGAARQPKCSRHLAFGIEAIGPTQLMGQLHLLRRLFPRDTQRVTTR